MARRGVAPAIGIHLGTTNSCVAVWQDDRVEIIPNDQGNRITPSCVAFTNSERLIGEAAKNQVAMNPHCTNFGRRFNDEIVQKVEKCLKDANMDKKNVDAVVLVGGSTKMPMVQQFLKEFFDEKKLYMSIPPDEVVACGAAVLAARLSAERRQKVQNLMLLDATPLSLGVSELGDIMSVLIPRNTPVPAERSKVYQTVEDNQPNILFRVYQGERVKASENCLLGEFKVAVPVAPRGKSKVKVVFNIDANGILQCSGEEITTGLKKKITISNDKRSLSKEEIEKMLKDAQKYKLADEEYKKKSTASKSLENYIHDVKKKMKTIGITEASLPEEDMKMMENAIEEASEYLDHEKPLDVDVSQSSPNSCKTDSLV